MNYVITRGNAKIYSALTYLVKDNKELLLIMKELWKGKNLMENTGWECQDCGKRFDDPEIRHTTYESYYGVSNMFENSTDLELYICPCCGSEDIKEFYEDEEEEEC